MKTIKSLLLFALFGQLAACSMFGGDERPVYQGAEYYKNLEIPPDLVQPETTEEVRVPKPTDEAMQRFRDNNKLDTVITPKFDGVRMVSYAGESWLEVDNKVEYVWGRIKEFFENEGIALVDERPLLGYVETEWTEKLAPEKGYFQSLMAKLEPDQKDKFRVRVEPFDNGNKTRIYLAHSRIERVVRGEFGDDVSWVSLPSELEVERELIARMALFAGMTKEQQVALLENYRPYSSLVKTDPADTTSLTMKGSMDFVWRRTMRALDRMEMHDIQQHPESSTITFLVKRLKTEDLEASAEEDELAKTSWLRQLIMGGDDDEQAERNYRLLFTDIDGRIRITVRDQQNTVTSDEDQAITGSARIEQIRNALIKYLE